MQSREGRCHEQREGCSGEGPAARAHAVGLRGERGEAKGAEGATLVAGGAVRGLRLAGELWMCVGLRAVKGGRRAGGKRARLWCARAAALGPRDRLRCRRRVANLRVRAHSRVRCHVVCCLDRLYGIAGAGGKAGGTRSLRIAESGEPSGRIPQTARTDRASPLCSRRQLGRAQSPALSASRPILFGSRAASAPGSLH